MTLIWWLKTTRFVDMIVDVESEYCLVVRKSITLPTTLEGQSRRAKVDRVHGNGLALWQETCRGLHKRCFEVHGVEGGCKGRLKLPDGAVRGVENSNGGAH